MKTLPASIATLPDLASHFLGQSPTPMVTAEGTDHIVGYVNLAFCRLLDKPATELLGKPFCKLLPQMHDCMTVLDRVFDTGEPESYTEPPRSKPDPPYWTYTIWPVNADDHPKRVVIEVTQATDLHNLTLKMNEALLLGAIRQHELTEVANASYAQLQLEVRERIEAEEALQQTQTQLVLQAGELEGQVSERTSELTTTNQQLEAFAYSIAHDLRAPLRAIQGFSAILVEEPGIILTEEGKSYAARINKSAQFMDAMLLDLLEFSRISQVRVELSAVNIKTIVDSVLSLLQITIKEKQASVTTLGPWPTVWAHEATLTQVLVNLISNALKFVAPDVLPQVRLRIDDRGEFVRVWIEDNGIGIAAEHQEQMFRVFMRLNAQQYPGTGIGLAIVQKGIERMGGRMGVESAPQQGSRFWLELRKV